MMAGIKNLAVQEWYDQLLQEVSKSEFGAKEFLFFKRTAETSALVLLAKVTVSCGIHIFDMECWQCRNRLVGSFLNTDSKFTRQGQPADRVANIIPEN
jgi:hypothetical protein